MLTLRKTPSNSYFVHGENMKVSDPPPYKGGARGGSLRKLAFFFFIVGFLFYAHTAFAITVSPALVEMTIDPGTKRAGSISIQNTEDRPVFYAVYLQNFIAKGEEGQQDFVGPNLVFQDTDWILPQSDSITLDSRQKIDFQYTVRVPKDAMPGGHYIVMFFSKKMKMSGDSTGASVNPKIGILFFIKVTGEIKEELQIESFRLMQSDDDLNRLPVVFETRFSNLGNIHLRPEGDIVIKNLFGQISAIIPLNPKGSLVLTKSIRRVESQWKKNADMSSGKKSGWLNELKNEWRNFAFGPYTAEIKGFYGDGKLPLSGKIKFWIIPWHLITAGVLGVIFLIFSVKIYRRLLVREMLKRTNKK